MAIGLLCTPVAAQAQVMCVNCETELHATMTDIATAASWLAQLTYMKNQLTQMSGTLASVAHLNPGSMQVGLGLLTNSMRLPGSSANAMPGLNFGSTTTSAGQQFYNQNHVYTPTGNDFAAQELQRRQVATSNLQGEALTGMQQIMVRLGDLAQLEQAIVAQPDVTAVAAIGARIASEKMFIANEGNNISHLNLLMATQDHVDQQRAEQNARMQSDQYAAAAATAAGW